MKSPYDHVYVSNENPTTVARGILPGRRIDSFFPGRHDADLSRLVFANPVLAQPGLEKAFGIESRNQYWVVCSFDIWKEDGRISEPGRIVRSCLAVVASDENTGVDFLSHVDASADPSHAVLLLLIWGPSADRTSRVGRGLAVRLSESFMNKGLQSASGIGSPYTSFPDIRQSLNESRLALSRRHTRTPGIFEYQRENELRGMACKDFESFPDLFCGALRKADQSEVAAHIDTLFDKLEHSEASIRKVNQDVQKIFSALADLAAQQMGDGTEFQLNSLEPYYHVFDYAQNPVQLRHRLQKLCSIIMQAILQNGTSFAERKVAEFRVYVEEHFMDLGLSVDSVGRCLQISPSYLRKLLRRSLGTTFVTFVTNYRIDRAKELLTGSDLTSYQVAEQVGYPYAHYFSAVFKRRVGVSPSDFRVSRRKGA